MPGCKSAILPPSSIIYSWIVKTCLLEEMISAGSSFRNTIYDFLMWSLDKLQRGPDQKNWNFWLQVAFISFLSSVKYLMSSFHPEPPLSELFCSRFSFWVISKLGHRVGGYNRCNAGCLGRSTCRNWVRVGEQGGRPSAISTSSWVPTALKDGGRLGSTLDWQIRSWWSLNKSFLISSVR